MIQKWDVVKNKESNVGGLNMKHKSAKWYILKATLKNQ